MTAPVPRRIDALDVDLPKLMADLHANGVARPSRTELQAELETAGETLAFLERHTLPELRRQSQAHEDGKKRWRDRAEKAEAKVRHAETVKCWTNEDGKRFVFADDLAEALGYGPAKAGESR